MPTPIARNLHHHMQKQSISSSELARLADVKSSFIYDILKGKSNNPSSVKLSKVASSLGITLAQLIEEGGANDAPPSLKIVSSQSFDETYIPTVLNVSKNGNDYTVETIKDQKAAPRFSKRFLTDQFGTSSCGSFSAMEIQDDVMAPTFFVHDYVLVDCSKKEPNIPGIYVLFDGKVLTIRRLELYQTRSEDWVRVSSDNQCYSSYEKPLEELNVIGRVVWFSRSLV